MPTFGKQEQTVKESFIDTGLNAPSNIDGDDYLYRSMTKSRHADLNPVTQDKMQRISLLLFRINPLANRIMKLTSAFVASGNVSIDAKDKKVQTILKKHWEHPVNDWENKLYQRVFELGMYGEQCLPVSTLPNGDVILGYVSPLEIDVVTPTLTDSSTPGTVILKKTPGESEGKHLEVVNYSLMDQRRVGEAFFFTINKVSDSLRGTSDLLPLADYMDALDQLLFSLLERVGHLNSYIWDVTMEGASQEKINAFLADIQSKPPKPGGVRAHNELVTWQAVSPNLHASDNQDHVRLYRNHILGGAGLAEWMFADAGSTGRAVASEMAEPTYKSLMTRQREVKGFLSHILNYVIDENIRLNKLPKGVNRDFTVNLPKISLRDFQRTSGALFRSAQALELLLETNMITEEKGQKLANSLLDQLDLGEESGVDVGSFQKINNPQAALAAAQAQPH